MNRNIILASQSPQRKNLLSQLRIPFAVVPSKIDEAAITAKSHLERAKQVAFAKAKEVQKQYPNAIIIAGDTYVVDGEKEFEKPKSKQEAIEMLTHLSGKKVQELTGFAYFDAQQKIEVNTTVVVDFRFRTLSKHEIESYVANEPVLTWSASFCPAYDSGAALVEEVHGSLTSFTHGLPIELVAENLKKSGITF
jgi:septum formation protein